MLLKNFAHAGVWDVAEKKQATRRATSNRLGRASQKSFSTASLVRNGPAENVL